MNQRFSPYGTPIRSFDSISFPEADNERKERRRPADYPATAWELRSTAAPVTITDINANGCRLRGAPFERGAVVWIRIREHAPMRARVIWSRGEEAGCFFYRPMTNAQLIALEHGIAPRAESARVLFGPAALRRR